MVEMSKRELMEWHEDALKRGAARIVYRPADRVARDHILVNPATKVVGGIVLARKVRKHRPVALILKPDGEVGTIELANTVPLVYMGAPKDET